MKKSLLFNFVSALLLLSIAGHGQGTFLYQSNIKPVPKAGFYKILLEPTLVAKCKDNLNDLRLLDTVSRQVPYILQSDPPAFRESNFIEFPVLSVSKESDKQTHIVIGNPDHKTISELTLVIKNTDADRSVTISGSDDNKQWFVIKENILLVNMPVPGKDRFVQYLTFPTSSYPFFKIIVNGENLLPVNIVKAGVYNGTQRAGSFTRLPAPVVRQLDSTDNRSYIQVIFNDKYRVNKLDLQVKGPKYFRRNLRLSRSHPLDEIEGLRTITSEFSATYVINIKSDSFIAIIDNDDNLPLAIESASGYQLNKYLWAYLEPQQNYQLVFGNTEANTPRYDLDFFKDKIANAEGTLSSGKVLLNKNAAVLPAGKKGKPDTLILWTIISLVLALLLVLTFRMTREIRKKQNDPL